MVQFTIEKRNWKKICKSCEILHAGKQ